MKWIAALGLCIALASCSSGNSPTPKAGESTSAAVTPSGDVLVRDSFFKPKTLTVKAGKTVVWAWSGTSLQHTVTSDVSGGFDSGAAVSSGTFKHTFDKAGTFRYHCSIHGGLQGAGMSGVIVVT